jgi:hypothetical protein
VSEEYTGAELEYLTRMAKIAYEAYCETTGWKSAISGADLPPFEKTPQAVQTGWIAAAKAVLDQAWEH